MNLTKFKNGKGKVAVTDDDTGAKLPASDGPWTNIGGVRVEASDPPRIGKGSEEILADVKREGYSLWPADE